MINGLELSVPLPPTSGEGRGAGDGIKLLMTNDLINHAYAMKPPQNPKKMGSERFWLGEHMEMQKEWHTQITWKLCPHSPYLALCISSIWLFLSYILY